MLNKTRDENPNSCFNSIKMTNFIKKITYTVLKMYLNLNTRHQMIKHTCYHWLYSLWSFQHMLFARILSFKPFFTLKTTQ